MRPRYFAIIGAMRTGSNLLERTLAALGDTKRYGEAFNPAFIGGPRLKTVQGWTKADRDRDPMGFLDHLISAEPGMIPGFRIFDGHPQAVLDRVLTDPDCARIILMRNRVDSYVSLLMARATDQWMLNDPAKRIAVRVAFDLDGYAAYDARLRAHYDHAVRIMRDAGTEAFWLDYADLGDPAVLQSVARHIGSTGQIPAQPPILRQNPGTLEDKVINHAEVRAALGLAAEVPSGDGGTAPMVLHSRHASLSIAPVEGPGLARLVAIVQRIETLAFGAAPAPRALLIADPARSGLFEVIAPAPGGDPLAGRQYLAPISHPFQRAHHLFCQEVFGQSWRKSWIRARVEAIVGDLPHPKHLDKGGLEVAIHRAAFQAFLDICFAADAAVQPYRPEWAPQADVIDALTSVSRAPEIIRDDDLAQTAGAITAALGVAPIPPGQLKSVLGIAGPPVLDIADVADPALEAMVYAAYRQDYNRFGYGPWCDHTTAAPDKKRAGLSPP